MINKHMDFSQFPLFYSGNFFIALKHIKNTAFIFYLLGKHNNVYDNNNKNI